MYYDNKRTFYVKQYGPTVLVSVIAASLILTGVLFYLNIGNKVNHNDIANNNPDEELVDAATNNGTADENKENNAPEVPPVSEPVKPDVVPEVPNVEETSALQTTEVVPYFVNLEKLTLSDNVKVTGVDNSGNISLEYNGDKLTVAMIGVNYTYATDATYSKIKSDLEGKEVRVAFDTERETNGVTNAYVYLDNTLYNASILKSGLATLKSERTNVALATDLSKAQADARSNKLGVWNR